MRTLRGILGILLALLPSWLKVPLYRWLFRYEIGKRVRIGFSPFIGVKQCRIGDDTRIGHFNVFYHIANLEVGDHGRIGFLNLFRGGSRISLGSYASVLRQNVFNAILEPDFINPIESTFEMGAGAVVTSGHWLDFSDRISVGAHTIIGGRNSSFWTHNRQRSRPISIGCHCYLGSEIRVAPGVEVAPFSIVSLGSVLMGKLTAPRSLIAGNPATVLRPLEKRDLFLVVRKTRNDLPDDLVRALLPADLCEILDELSMQGNGALSKRKGSDL